MPTIRAYVPLAGVVCSNDELACGFAWLLSRPETQLHVCAPKVEMLDQALSTLEGKYSGDLKAIFARLRAKGSVTLTDNQGTRVVTAAGLHPRPLARANGACLVVWGDSNQLVGVERAIGAIGAVCVVPWSAQGINNWIAEYGPTVVDCQNVEAVGIEGGEEVEDKSDAS